MKKLIKPWQRLQKNKRNNEMFIMTFFWFVEENPEPTNKQKYHTFIQPTNTYFKYYH